MKYIYIIFLIHVILIIGIIFKATAESPATLENVNAGNSEEEEQALSQEDKDAEELWTSSSERIHKTRYSLDIPKENWIIDCFHENNHPLILAEIELSSKTQKIIIPSWCGPEITGHYQWSNASLAKTPISSQSIESRLKQQNRQEGHSFL